MSAPQQLGFLPAVPLVIGGAGAVVGYKTANALNPTSNPRTLYLLGAVALVALLVLRK